jgi:branched-chain amino acid transport system substrate-binding protein
VAFRNSYWKEDEKTAMSVEFTAAFKKRYGRSPNAWAAIAFDSAWVLFQAIEKIKGPVTGLEIQRSLARVDLEHLVTTGHFSFGPDNSPERSLFIYKISAAGIEYMTTLK